MCVSQGMGVTILPEKPYDYLPLNDKYYSLRETANDDAGFWYRLRRCYKADFKSQSIPNKTYISTKTSKPDPVVFCGIEI